MPFDQLITDTPSSSGLVSKPLCPCMQNTKINILFDNLLSEWLYKFITLLNNVRLSVFVLN